MGTVPELYTLPTAHNTPPPHPCWYSKGSFAQPCKSFLLLSGKVHGHTEISGRTTLCEGLLNLDAYAYGKRWVQL